MKKLLLFTATAAGAAGLLAYMKKNGLPVLGNLTMNLPVQTGIDPYDYMVKGIHFLENKGISV